MKLLLGLLISLAVFSLAQEETDPFDRLACLDEDQRSQPISETARCNADGELYDPFEGFNGPPDSGDFTEAELVLMRQHYDEEYAKLSPFQLEQLARGRLWFNGYEFSLVPSRERYDFPENSTTE
ncbi:MAG: hypothetical protein AAF708_00460 [Deinococcota bacterium]